MAEHRQRFLVIRLSSIGDIVHALPAVAALGETFPGAEIHWAVETRYAVLLEGNPYVSRVVKLDTRGRRRKLTAPRTVEELVRSLMALGEFAYDAAVDFQGLLKSALIARLSRSPLRLGFRDHWLRELPAGVFYTERVAPRERAHVIEMNLALVERLGARASRWGFPLPRSSADDGYVERQLSSLGAQDFIVVSPGGGWKAKCWAPENYAELIRRLAIELPCKVLLTGSREEEDLIRGILQGAESRHASYLPATIIQFIALVRRARLFVGGDSGPLHLAAAVGTPIVAIYGAQDLLNTPERNGPFSPADITLLDRSQLDSGGGGKGSAYLTGIPVEPVIAAIGKRLARAYG